MEKNNDHIRSKKRKKPEKQWRTTTDSLDFTTDMLDRILQHFDMKDVTKMRTVSKSWDYACRQVLQTRRVPMMLLVSNRHRDTRHLVINATNPKAFFRLKLRDFSTCSCLGSAHGCLILLSKKKRENHHHSRLTLLNPFTGAHNELPLLVPRFDSDFSVYLSSAPNSGNCFVIGGPTINGKSFYWKQGDAGWTEMEQFSSWRYSLVIFKGQVYAVDFSGRLFIIELDPFRITKVSVSPPSEISNMANFLMCRTHRFLIESNGNLLLVGFQKEFVVFRLDFTSMVWGKIDSLGDRAIFLDKQHCFSVSAGRTGCSANCIYYHFSEGFSTENDPAWRVYDLGSQNAKPILRETKSPATLDRKVWICIV